MRARIRIQFTLALGTLALLLLGSVNVSFASPKGGHDEHAHASEHDTHAPAPPAPINTFDRGYSDKDDHGGPYEDGDHHMAPPLLLALANFFLFAALLYWKAGPVIRKYFANRHETIRTALDESARLHSEAKAKLEQCEKRVAKVDNEIEKLINEIRADALTERRQLLEEAKKRADDITRSAQEQVEAEISRARIELEREVITTAISAAEKIINEKVTSVDQGTLVTGFIAELKQPKAVDEDRS